MTRVRVPNRTFSTCVITGSGGSVCGSSNGASTFLELTDTPDSYAGFSGKSVKVNVTEDGLEFGDVVASGLDSVVINSSGGTITLDMNNQNERMFIATPAIGAAKTWALSNDASAIYIPSVRFVMSTTDIQSFPANFVMSSFDANWDSSTQEWTPPDAGTYEMSASFDGTLWLMKITGPFV